MNDTILNYHSMVSEDVYLNKIEEINFGFTVLLLLSNYPNIKSIKRSISLVLYIFSLQVILNKHYDIFSLRVVHIFLAFKLT